MTNFQDVAHHYQGCKVKLIDGSYGDNTLKLIKVLGTNYKLDVDGRFSITVNRTKIKPVLRSVSQLSNDECIEVCILHWGPNVPPLTRADFEVHINVFNKKFVSWGPGPVNSYLVERLNGDEWYYNQYQTLYLMSIGVDIFGLINSGQAIKA